PPLPPASPTLSLPDALPISVLPSSAMSCPAPHVGSLIRRGAFIVHLLDSSPCRRAGFIDVERRVRSTSVLASTHAPLPRQERWRDRKSTRLNSSHVKISYAV